MREICTTCGKHIPSVGASCPGCSSKPVTPIGRSKWAAGMVVVAVSMSPGCPGYGMAPDGPFPPTADVVSQDTTQTDSADGDLTVSGD